MDNNKIVKDSMMAVKPLVLIAMLCGILLLAACDSGTADESPTGDTATVTAPAAEVSPTEESVPEEVSLPTVAPAPEEEAVAETDAAPEIEAEAEAPASEMQAVEMPVGEGAEGSVAWEEGPITFKSPSLDGAMTASGEPFDKDSLSAAHKTLPFGTVVTVTNLFNGMSTTVTVNDRLPEQVSAVIDISPAAASEIDMIDAGIVDGRIEW